MDKNLYDKLCNIANRRIKNISLRQDYIKSMYVDLGGKMKEEKVEEKAEITVEEKVEQQVEEKVEISIEVDSDSDTEYHLQNLFSQSTDTEEEEEVDNVKIGDIMESDDKNYRFMVQVGEQIVHFGKSDEIIIWEITGSVNRIKTRYITRLGDANDPFKSSFWVKHVLWTNTEETIEDQFEIARDQAEMMIKY